MRFVLLFLAAFFATAADARGFVTRDLAPVEAAARAALGRGYIGRATPGQLLFTCEDCDGAPTVTVLIGTQTDGTEARVRSGQTTIAALEGQCQARSPRCTIAALPVGPAVGWVSGYPLGEMAGATAVILRDGDMLTVRALADTPAAARGAIDRLLSVLRARVIGAVRTATPSPS